MSKYIKIGQNIGQNIKKDDIVMYTKSRHDIILQLKGLGERTFSYCTVEEMEKDFERLSKELEEETIERTEPTSSEELVKNEFYEGLSELEKEVYKKLEALRKTNHDDTHFHYSFSCNEELSKSYLQIHIYGGEILYYIPQKHCIPEKQLEKITDYQALGLYFDPASKNFDKLDFSMIKPYKVKNDMCAGVFNSVPLLTLIKFIAKNYYV